MNLNPLQQSALTANMRSAYSRKSRVQIRCPELPYGRTKQSFKDDADINTIVNRFLRTGIFDSLAKNEPRYGDCTGIEYTAAMQTCAAAKSLFEDLPSHIRARFENEPAKFLDFIQDDKNLAEARKLGLCKPAPVDSDDAKPKALPPSHREDGSATHEPLRARDGTYREHTRKEKREEARADREADKNEPWRD